MYYNETMWQDTVIAICNLAFVPAMLPTILGNDKPALSTSVLNALIVSIIAFSLATLQLWLAFTSATVIAFIWAILAVQKLKLGRRVEAEPVAAQEEGRE